MGELPKGDFFHPKATPQLSRISLVGKNQNGPLPEGDPFHPGPFSQSPNHRSVESEGALSEDDSSHPWATPRIPQISPVAQKMMGRCPKTTLSTHGPFSQSTNHLGVESEGALSKDGSIHPWATPRFPQISLVAQEITGRCPKTAHFTHGPRPESNKYPPWHKK